MSKSYVRLLHTKIALILLTLSTLFTLSVVSIVAISRKEVSAYKARAETKSISPIILFPTPTSTPTLTPSPTAIPTPTMPPAPTAKLIFGMGSQAGPAMDYPLVKEAPIQMLTSWYNGTKDLEWMRVQQNDLIPRLYANNYIVHLITWTDLPEEEVQTPYGTACGRPYPISNQIIEDMKQLAEIYNGPGPMYVTLFTEFQTYTCWDNDWNGNENYWRALMDNYRKIKDVFHEKAPNSKVALSWGGWISRYDDQEHQGGRSLISHFDDVLRESDFTAFQAMESDTNIQEMLDMTSILGGYGKPVMLSHYKPHSDSADLFYQDMQRFFTDEVIGQLTQKGLFAFSFMDYALIEGRDNTYQLLKSGIQKYAK